MKKRHTKSTRRSGRLQTVTLCISTALVLILLGLVVFFTLTGRNLSAYVKENLQVTMMLEQDMTDNEAQTIMRSIAQRPYIKTIHFISKESALKDAAKQMGADPSTFTDGVNPFSSSIELTLTSDYANNDSLVWISKELKKYPKVSDISYQKDLIEAVNRNLTKIGMAMLVLAILLTFVSFSLINNTVRLGIYARRFSIHTMKLVGASWGFIRRPFVWSAVGVGVIAAPLAAACGAKVAKMSGRGLGFTGGTLDKLESIPGMSIDKDIEGFKRQVNEVGCAIIGQTAELAPADKVLYALRDVTATVDCLPLVVSSILSKKLAAGCDVVVLDVKSGSGAIMDTPEKSRQLAETMVRIGNMSGKRFSALITDMDQPLGNYIGNALEVEEAIDVLAGRVNGPLKDVALTLGAHILRNAGTVGTVDAGIRMLQAKIDSGEGLKTFGDMIEAQGGDRRVVEDTSLLPKAPKQVELRVDKAGYITRMVTSDIGNAAKLLGAGRERKTDVLDLSVGIVMHKRLGESVKRDELLATLHVGERSDRIGAYNLLKKSIVIGDEKPDVKPLIQAVVE